MIYLNSLQNTCISSSVYNVTNFSLSSTLDKKNQKLEKEKTKLGKKII